MDQPGPPPRGYIHKHKQREYPLIEVGTTRREIDFGFKYPTNSRSEPPKEPPKEKSKRGRKKGWRKISQDEFNQKLPKLLSKYAAPTCAWEPTRELVAGDYNINKKTLDDRFKDSPYKSIKNFKAEIRTLRITNRSRSTRITK